MNKIAVMFPGQGRQTPGIYRSLYENYEVVRDTFQEASDAAHVNMKKICFDSTIEEILKLENSQKCVMTVEVAGYRLLKFLGYDPSVMIGCSFGAYSAAVAGGVLPLEQGLRVGDMRGEIIHNVIPPDTSGMIVIMNQSTEEINNLCEMEHDNIWVSNYNCPTQIVLSGKKDSVLRIYNYALQNDISAVIVDVDFASHCPLMKPATEKMHRYLSRIPFLKADIPVIANSNAEYMTDALEIKNELAVQLCNPVQLEKSVQNAMSKGVNVFIEIGPGKSLSGNVSRISGDIKVCRIEDIDTLRETCDILNG